jgi:predicted phage terminase large subunit-like protein
MNAIPADFMNEILRTDFTAFLQKAFQTIHPTAKFMPNWHHEAIAHALEECKKGPGHNLLLVNLPPRHLKSEIIAVAYPAFILGHEPGASIITVSYGADLVKRLSRQRRQIIESDWYKKVFTQTRISPAKNTETEFETTAGGRCYATTIRGELTGHGAKYIFVDDPHNVSQRPTADELKEAWEWFSKGLFTRFEQPEKGAVVVVMQRYHPNDLAGYLMADAGFRQLKLEAIATADQDVSIGGTAVHQRVKGDILHPDWFSAQMLEQRKNIMGPDAFDAQYQQDPKPGGQSLFKPEYFPLYDKIYPRNRYEYVLQAWDAASSLSEDASYSVCMTFGVMQNKLHLLHVFRRRMEYPELLEAAEKLIDRFGPTHICIEYASLGQPLFADLRERHGPQICHDIPKHDKQTRAEAVLHLVTAGRMMLPSDNFFDPPFKATLEQELFAFPGAPHDDQVDALVLALMFLQHNVFARAPLNYGSRKLSLAGFRNRTD